MSSSKQRPSRPSTSGSRPTTSGGTAGFRQLLEVAFSGDRNRFVDAVESIGLAEMMGCDVYGNTLLHLMAATGDLKMVKLLLRLGIPGDALNSVGQTAAALAEDCGMDAIADYLNRKIQPATPDLSAAAEARTNDVAPIQEGADDDNFQQDYLDAVLNYALLIGIDAMEEPHLLPIAEEGLAAPLPAEWQERDGVFVHVASGSAQSHHPNDDVFRQRVLEARAKAGDASADGAKPNVDGADDGVRAYEAAAGAEQQASDDAIAETASDGASSSAYEEDFEEAAEHAPEEAALQLQSAVLDENATRVMFLLQERLKLKSRDMERFGRLTPQAATPEFMPKLAQGNNGAYGVREHAPPSKEREHSGSPEMGSALPAIKLSSPNVSPVNKSEFDRLMRRYMGFSSTQTSTLLDDRRQRQQAIRDALRSINEKQNNITSSLRHFLNSKSPEPASSKRAQRSPAAKHIPSPSCASLPPMHSASKERATLLSVSPLQGPARPRGNPWIQPPQFSVLFNPQHMRPSKANSKYSKINPRFMDGRALQSPSVSVPLYPSISPTRISDDNDAFAYVLDPRRKHRLLAKQTQRSDRAQCASPWSPELKKSGVWDRNGRLDCNAFLFGGKYVHYNRQQVVQMDLDEELRRKGVRSAEELLWPNPDPYRHIKKKGASAARSP